MRDELENESARRWRARGEMLRVDGVRVFALSEGHGGGEGGQTTVFLHGFPTSSHDFHAILPSFACDRAVTLDLPGFGLSDKPPDRDYSLFRQADVVDGALAALGVRRAHLVAHDMGTSIACEVLARRERGALGFEVQSLALMNGSVHIEMAHLTPSQRLLLSPIGPAFARLASRVVFDRQIRRIVTRISDRELDAMWELLARGDGKRRLPKIIRYVEERRRFSARWVGALARLDVPALVLWGTEDPVAVIAIAERLAREIPGAELVRLEGLGHYPQLEDPERVVDALRAFHARVAGGASAAGGAEA